MCEESMNQSQVSLETMRRAQFEIFNPLPLPARSVRVLMAFPRGSLSDPRIISEENEQLVKAEVQDNVVYFNWDKPGIEPGHQFAFNVETTVSPLFLVRAYWSESPTPIATTSGLSFPDINLAPSFPISSNEETEKFWTTRGKARCSCKEFFAEYDKRFNPEDVRNNKDMTDEQKTRRIDAVEKLLDTLIDRRDVRAEAARIGNKPKVDDLPDPPARDLIAHLSEAQLDLFRECFPDGAGGIDYGTVQDCFEKFANGELRNPDKPKEREPDSGYYFLFAEFAFLALAESVNASEWAKLLRTFVKTQEIFINTYRPPQPNPTLDDYTPDHFQARQQSDDARKKQLRRTYDDLSPDELEERARSNMQRAQS
jgi:hypothetical protein